MVIAIVARVAALSFSCFTKKQNDGPVIEQILPPQMAVLGSFWGPL